VDGGINLFDTAEVYGFGRSEYLCGKFKRDYQGEQARKTATLHHSVIVAFVTRW
jgi:aryl-alcohol dehydrogenase-like predicted oxidoreductase